MFCKLILHSNSACQIIRLNGYKKLLISRSFSSIKGTTELLNLVSNMIKSKKEAKARREELKVSAGKAYLQVLGSGATGAPKSLYFFTDNSRYLFNCGEGSQRLAHEHKIKLSKLEHIFVTTSTWDSIGGLPGLSLTIQDCGVTNINLHGPPGLNELYEATKRFIVMKNMKVQMMSCQQFQPYEDQVLSVSYVPLMKEGAGTYKSLLESEKTDRQDKEKMSRRSESPGTVVYDDTDYYDYENKDNNERIRSQSTSRTNKMELNDDYDRSTIFRKPRREQVCSMAYICKLSPKLGTLDLEKCVELGVKPGPLLGQLKNGCDVVLEDDRLIRAADVKTPDEPGPIFIVLDVPDTSYLDSLMSEKLFYEFRTSKNLVEKDVKKLPLLMVHFSPQSIVNDERYQVFINDFSKNTKHMFVNDSNTCLGSLGVHQVQQKLHILDETVFPMIRECGIRLATTSDNSVVEMNSGQLENKLENQESAEICNQIATAQFRHILMMEDGEDLKWTNNNENNIEGRTLAMFHLRPMDGFDDSRQLKLDIGESIAEVMNTEGFAESLQEYKNNANKIRSGNAETYPKVQFLGTGSSIPSKTRNTSAILIHVSENSIILLDCAEGTYGQIIRLFGPALANKVLLNIKAIYVSHLHADHHLGLIGVLQGRRKAFNSMKANTASANISEASRKVYLLAPGQILPWLNFYDKRFENICDDYEIVPNYSILYMESDRHANYLPPYIQNQLEVTNIQTCQVRHCPNAFGVAVTIGDKKVTYSGDTVPCDDLVKLGINSTLLIHEATMEDELAIEAKVKMHSTTSQAVEIGNKMNAKFVILTHFSQRYARMPRLKNLKEGIDMHNVGIAFDNMQISLDQLAVLPHMYEPLKLIFAEHCHEMDMRALKRTMKRKKNLSPTAARTKLITNALQDLNYISDTNGKDQSSMIDSKKQKESR